MITTDADGLTSRWVTNILFKCESYLHNNNIIDDSQSVPRATNDLVTLVQGQAQVRLASRIIDKVLAVEHYWDVEFPHVSFSIAGRVWRGGVGWRNVRRPADAARPEWTLALAACMCACVRCVPTYSYGAATLRTSSPSSSCRVAVLF